MRLCRRRRAAHPNRPAGRHCRTGCSWFVEPAPSNGTAGSRSWIHAPDVEDVNRLIPSGGVGGSEAAGLEVNPSFATTSMPACQVAGRAASQALKTCLERVLDDVQQPAWSTKRSRRKPPPVWVSFARLAPRGQRPCHARRVRGQQQRRASHGNIDQPNQANVISSYDALSAVNEESTLAYGCRYGVQRDGRNG